VLCKRTIQHAFLPPFTTTCCLLSPRENSHADILDKQYLYFFFSLSSSSTRSADDRFFFGRVPSITLFSSSLRESALFSRTIQLSSARRAGLALPLEDIRKALLLFFRRREPVFFSAMCALLGAEYGPCSTLFSFFHRSLALLEPCYLDQGGLLSNFSGRIVRLLLFVLFSSSLLLDYDFFRERPRLIFFYTTDSFLRGVPLLSVRRDLALPLLGDRAGGAFFRRTS